MKDSYLKLCWIFCFQIILLIAKPFFSIAIKPEAFSDCMLEHNLLGFISQGPASDKHCVLPPHSPTMKKRKILRCCPTCLQTLEEARVGNGDVWSFFSSSSSFRLSCWLSWTSWSSWLIKAIERCWYKNIFVPTDSTCWRRWVPEIDYSSISVQVACAHTCSSSFHPVSSPHPSFHLSPLFLLHTSVFLAWLLSILSSSLGSTNVTKAWTKVELSLAADQKEK